ncbi:MAG: large conductance mechanosensitive channel protein MscL [Oscillospiraceae bacterium]|nr:large conductance mechanosensitive channel protein MscL [Oscillospiraceae bacterium]
MKKFLKEFKEFAVKGNVMSLAVGVIIGAAFQGVVTSLTDNVLSPLIGLFMGQNFDALEAGFLGVTLSYGKFITSAVNFLIMAFVVFLMVRAMNRVMRIGKKPAPPAPPPRLCPYCKTEIHREAVKCRACTSEL